MKPVSILNILLSRGGEGEEWGGEGDSVDSVKRKEVKHGEF